MSACPQLLQALSTVIFCTADSVVLTPLPSSDCRATNASRSPVASWGFPEAQTRLSWPSPAGQTCFAEGIDKPLKADAQRLSKLSIAEADRPCCSRFP